VDPGFVLSEDVVDTGFINVDADHYFSARDAYGSPAYDEAEIAAAPEFVRYAADKVLFGALGIGLETLPGSAVPRAGCRTVPSDGGASPHFALPPGGITIVAGDGPIERFELSRFSTGPAPVVIAGIGAGEAGRLAIPEDKAGASWKLRLATAAPALACGVDVEDGG
jgi:hypothetical protein